MNEDVSKESLQTVLRLFAKELDNRDCNCYFLTSPCATDNIEALLSNFLANNCNKREQDTRRQSYCFSNRFYTVHFDTIWIHRKLISSA